MGGVRPSDVGAGDGTGGAGLAGAAADTTAGGGEPRTLDYALPIENMPPEAVWKIIDFARQAAK